MALDFQRCEYEGRCHCGTVQFRVRLADGLNSARRCDCSFCRMRGAVAITALDGDIEITSGKEALTLYTFNSHVAQHYFCQKCGIYTFHRRRSDPNQWGVNAACLTGVSPFDFAAVEVNNGQVHPSDADAATRGSYQDVVGVLRFEPTDSGGAIK